jgi:hypothetical protein
MSTFLSSSTNRQCNRALNVPSSASARTATPPESPETPGVRPWLATARKRPPGWQPMWQATSPPVATRPVSASLAERAILSLGAHLLHLTYENIQTVI